MAATENLDISDEAKACLQNQVEELIFVEHYIKFKGYCCCACKKLAIVHCIANCRDVYCNNCYLEYYNQPCSSCKETVQTKEQDSEFEREVFRFKAECKFKKNGCEEIVELRNFLDHILGCKYSTGKLLPKLYRKKEDPIADALQQLNGDDNPVKEVMELMHAEIRGILNEMNDMKNFLRDNVELQAATLKEPTDEFHKKETDELLQSEIMQIKQVFQGIKEMQEENNREMKNIKEHTKVLTEKDRKNNNATEVTKAEIMQLKATLKNTAGEYKALIEENNSNIKKLQKKPGSLAEIMLNEISQVKKDLKKCDEANKKLEESITEIKDITKTQEANKKTAKLMQNEIDALKKHEEAGAALQKENKSQMKNLEENHKAFKLLMNDNAHKNKIATELTQKEITLLKEALQKSKEATKELQLEYKGEIQKIESQQRLHLEDLQTKLGTQFRNELTEWRYLQEGDSIGGPVAILWKIAGFKEKLNDLLSGKVIEIMSEEFFIINDGLKFKPKLRRYFDVEFIYIHLEFDHNSTGKSNKCLPYLHSRKYILLDQSNALEKTNIELIDRPDFGMNSTEEMMSPHFTYSLFFPVCLFKGENRYLKNDQLLIKIILKPISFLYKNVASSDGILLWRIDNYSKKKRDEIEGFPECLQSKPFKTSETGYLLQVELFLNGIFSGEGQYLSIYLRLLMGENDANLPSTFKYKGSFSLMHQSDSQTIDDIDNHTYSFESDNTRVNFFGYTFILQSQAENPKYLKGDSLLIKTVVQVL